MKKKIRKKRPEPPWYFYFDTDNCYRCKNKNGCGGCKFLKRYIASKQHQKRKKIDFFKNFRYNIYRKSKEKPPFKVWRHLKYALYVAVTTRKDE